MSVSTAKPLTKRHRPPPSLVRILVPLIYIHSSLKTVPRCGRSETDFGAGCSFSVLFTLFNIDDAHGRCGPVEAVLLILIHEDLLRECTAIYFGLKAL